MQNDKLRAETTNLVTLADAIQVHDPEMLDAATVFLRDVKKLESEIESTFGPIVSKCHEAHKEALAQKKKYLEPLQGAEKKLRKKITDYGGELPAEAGVTKRIVWSYVITNIDRIPKKWMIPDDKKIKAEIKQMKDLTRIPGLKAIKKEILSVRK